MTGTWCLTDRKSLICQKRSRDMDSPWTPFDFILNGEFADASHLCALVGGIREEVSAVCSILLVHHAGEVVQNLMYVRDRDVAREAEVQNQLAGLTWNYADSQQIARLLRTPRGALMPLPRLLGSLQFSALQKLTENFSDAQGRLFVSERKPRRLVATQLLAPLIGLLCIDPDPSKDLACKSLDDLAIAVNASPQVFLRRKHSQRELMRRTLQEAEREIERHFEDRVQADRIETGPEAKSAAGSSLPRFNNFLKKILQETGSSQGSIFMIDAAPELLLPMARLGPTTDGYAAFEGTPIDTNRKEPGVVALVFKQARVTVFNDGRDFALMNQKTGLRQFSDEHKITSDSGLAVPIIDRSGPSTIGVVNLEKTLGERGPGLEGLRPFSLDDCWFVQEAAERFSAAWTRGWNDALYQIVKESHRRLRPFSLRSPSSVNVVGRDTPDSQDLPSDFASSQYEIRDLLESLCNAVPSISACAVRVLSVDQSKAVLLATYPKALHDRIPDPIALTDFFPIVGVIRSGKPIYGPSTELPAPFPGLRSYFSSPIILGSRCVGVVTFASKFAISLLQYHDDALREATEAIARAIEFAQNQALAMVLGQRQGS